MKENQVQENKAEEKDTPEVIEYEAPEVESSENLPPQCSF